MAQPKTHFIEAVLTCEGNLHDPDFSTKFQVIVDNLKHLLDTNKKEELFQIRKIEPWNSVRVTISIPKEAAQKLKLLAQQGSNVLKDLGILSVQVEGDQVISLTLAGSNNEPTQVIFRQTQDLSCTDQAASSNTFDGSFLAQSFSNAAIHQRHTPTTIPLAIPGPSGVRFSFNSSSPNVVAPTGEGIPSLPQKHVSTAVGSRTSFTGPFPFASMAHAAHTLQRGDTQSSPAQVPSDSFNINNSTIISSHNSTSYIKNNSSMSSSLVSNSGNLNVGNIYVIEKSTNSNHSAPTTQLSLLHGVQQGINSPTATNVSLLTQSETVKSDGRVICNSNYTGNLNSNNAISQASQFILSSTSLQQPSSNQSLQLQLVSAGNSVTPPPPYPHNQKQYIGTVQVAQQNSGGSGDKPVSSPLLVNLLQHGDTTTQSSVCARTQASPINQIQEQASMPPPVAISGTALENQLLYRRFQQAQEQKLKRAMSLDSSIQPHQSNNNVFGDLLPISVTSNLSSSNASYSLVSSPSTNSRTDFQFSMPLPCDSISKHGSSEHQNTAATIFQQSNYSPSSNSTTTLSSSSYRIMNSPQIVTLPQQQQSSKMPGAVRFQGQGQALVSANNPKSHNIIQVQNQHSKGSLMNGPIPLSTHIQSSQFSSASAIAQINSPSIYLHSATVANNYPTSARNTSNPQQTTTTALNSTGGLFRAVTTFSSTTTNIATAVHVTKIPVHQAMSTLADQQQIHSLIPMTGTVTQSNNSGAGSSSFSQMAIPAALTTSTSVSINDNPSTVVANLIEATEVLKTSPSQTSSVSNTPVLFSSTSRSPSNSSLPLQPVGSGKPKLLLINPLTGHLETAYEDSVEDEEDQKRKKGTTARRGLGKGKPAEALASILGKQQTSTLLEQTKELQKQITLLQQQEQLLLQQQQQKQFSNTSSFGNTAQQATSGGRKSSFDGQHDATTGEKIKLRLKLEKNEPVSPAYKVDVSFVKDEKLTSGNGNAANSLPVFSAMSSISALSSASSSQQATGDQPRVPPLHISLRGKNAAVVVSPRRDEKESTISNSDVVPPPLIPTTVSWADLTTSASSVPAVSENAKSPFINLSEIDMSVMPSTANPKNKSKNRLKSTEGNNERKPKTSRPKYSNPDLASTKGKLNRPKYIPGKIRPKSASFSSSQDIFAGESTPSNEYCDSINQKKAKKSRRKSEYPLIESLDVNTSSNSNNNNPPCDRTDSNIASPRTEMSKSVKREDSQLLQLLTEPSVPKLLPISDQKASLIKESCQEEVSSALQPVIPEAAKDVVSTDVINRDLSMKDVTALNKTPSPVCPVVAIPNDSNNSELMQLVPVENIDSEKTVTLEKDEEVTKGGENQDLESHTVEINLANLKRDKFGDSMGNDQDVTRESEAITGSPQFQPQHPCELAPTLASQETSVVEQSVLPNVDNKEDVLQVATDKGDQDKKASDLFSSSVSVENSVPSKPINIEPLHTKTDSNEEHQLQDLFPYEDSGANVDDSVMLPGSDTAEPLMEKESPNLDVSNINGPNSLPHIDNYEQSQSEPFQELIPVPFTTEAALRSNEKSLIEGELSVNLEGSKDTSSEEKSSFENVIAATEELKDAVDLMLADEHDIDKGEPIKISDGQSCSNLLKTAEISISDGQSCSNLLKTAEISENTTISKNDSDSEINSTSIIEDNSSETDLTQPEAESSFGESSAETSLGSHLMKEKGCFPPILPNDTNIMDCNIKNEPSPGLTSDYEGTSAAETFDQSKDIDAASNQNLSSPSDNVLSDKIKSETEKSGIGTAGCQVHDSESLHNLEASTLTVAPNEPILPEAKNELVSVPTKEDESKNENITPEEATLPKIAEGNEIDPKSDLDLNFAQKEIPKEEIQNVKTDDSNFEKLTTQENNSAVSEIPLAAITNSVPCIRNTPNLAASYSSLKASVEASGATAEDSGIDSMDALSEKSPNQGESPIRKEIDPSHENNKPKYSSQVTSVSVSSPIKNETKQTFNTVAKLECRLEKCEEKSSVSSSDACRLNQINIIQGTKKSDRQESSTEQKVLTIPVLPRMEVGLAQRPLLRPRMQSTPILLRPNSSLRASSTGIKTTDYKLLPKLQPKADDIARETIKVFPVQPENVDTQAQAKIEIQNNPNPLNFSRNNAISVPTVIQITRASTIASPTFCQPRASSPMTSSSPGSLVSISLPQSVNCTNTPKTTLFTIHSNSQSNLSQQFHQQSQQLQHGHPTVTVLPSGHKVVPIKLVTIPRNHQAPMASLIRSPLNRSSPNFIDAMRSSAFRNVRTSSVQGTPLNISAMQMGVAGSGNVTLVPISAVPSNVQIQQNPVKLLVSTPLKGQPNLLKSVVVKSMVVGGNSNNALCGGTSVRVIRPDASSCSPGNGGELIHSSGSKPLNLEPSKLDPPGAISVDLPQKLSEQKLLHETLGVRKTESVNTLYKGMQGVELLDTSLSDMNEQGVHFHADIIHDEKDLADAVAADSPIITQNGVESPTTSAYDFTSSDYEVLPPQPRIASVRQVTEEVKNENKTCGSPADLQESSLQVEELMNSNVSTIVPSSPVRLLRSNSPLYTYSNRSTNMRHKNLNHVGELSSSATLPLDDEEEDQEIIDSFAKSQSQPSSKNLAIELKDKHFSISDHSYNMVSLNSNLEDYNMGELSIDIPTVDAVLNETVEERERTKGNLRNTRSNTRLPSPDITAFRSDTPKSMKKVDLVFKNSPKASPTGNLKLLSPNLGGGSGSSSARASPICTSASITTGGKLGAKVSIKRKRQESDSSSASKDGSVTEDVKELVDINSRPGKRRCSENVAELVKACIGIEDNPKRVNSFFKRTEDAKVSREKCRKNNTGNIVDQDELDSLDFTSTSHGRTGSRGSSEDRSSSRGSSVQRSVISKVSAMEEDLAEGKGSRSQQNTSTKRKTKNSEGSGSSVKAAPKEAQAGRRSNRNSTFANKSGGVSETKRKKTDNSPEITEKVAGSPKNENLRRKTRSSVAGLVRDGSSVKRRKLSKDLKM